MNNDKAREILKKELQFELESTKVGWAVFKGEELLYWVQDDFVNLWQAALSRAVRLQKIAKIAEETRSRWVHRDEESSLEVISGLSQIEQLAKHRLNRTGRARKQQWNEEWDHSAKQ